jgi:transcriptional regulator with PAS, ATPase and Fis domain
VVNLLRKPKVVKNTMSEPCIKQTPQLRVISKRMKGNYDETIGKLITEIMGAIHTPGNKRSLVNIISPFMIICHDDEYVEEGADMRLLHL